MAMVKSIKEFKNIGELTAICDSSDEPNIITKNSEGNLVLMSLADYEEKRYDKNLYYNLQKATNELRGGKPLKEGNTFIAEMRASIWQII